MPEYHVLRLLLAAAEAVVVVAILRQSCGYLFEWGIYLYFAAASDTLPAYVHDLSWWQWVWQPVQIGVMVLLFRAAVRSFAFLTPFTGRRERTLLAALAAIVAGVLTAGLMRHWQLHPATEFQQFCALRMYFGFLVAVAHSFAWVYVRWHRPVPASALARRHGILICTWLWVWFVSSTSYRNGLLWQFFAWEDGEPVWRLHSGLCILAQISLMFCWWKAIPVSRHQSVPATG